MFTKILPIPSTDPLVVQTTLLTMGSPTGIACGTQTVGQEERPKGTNPAGRLAAGCIVFITGKKRCGSL